MAKKRNVNRRKKDIKSKTDTITNSDSNHELPQKSMSQNANLKVCRLCENKEGPFLGIFEAEKTTAKKIDEIMPFVISENDDLPQKICFRCSAKVEELHEFVQKCVNTQINLRNAAGREGPLEIKKSRKIWEEHLNQSNMLNENLCDAVLKRAMKGISDIPVLPLPAEETPKNDSKNLSNKKNATNLQVKKGTEESPKSEKEINKVDEKTTTNTLQLRNRKDKNEIDKPEENKSEKVQVVNTNTVSKNETTDKPPEAPKPFNIMDHVSMIKVNGVGVLFQCELCNRNFLRKDVVMAHGCSKNGGKKIAEEVKPIVQEPPKIPLIKYINTKPPNEVKKPPFTGTISTIILDDDDNDTVKTVETPMTVKKQKPKIGPASKVKRYENESKECLSKEEQSNKAVEAPQSNISPSIQFPSVPQMNSRYKLVPGPNNTFTLVEDKSIITPEKPAESLLSPKITTPPPLRLIERTPEHKAAPAPYPVGLIKKVSHHTPPFPDMPTTIPEKPAPASKKQSYTIVQTGNPSKLLISTKPQPETDVVPKKRSRKTQHTLINQPPYSVILEQNDHPKDPEFFTFVNVDPLLEPSYVLPTDSIVQESQISTSNKGNQVVDKEKDKYSCNLCGESFSREKKLLSHIKFHYNKMDEEDQMRAQKTGKKRKS
ncbi:unnamed protein product [Leptidea sinapis]|uniref:Uncharacterized protein n=1 Tax=Leptidea sinapis TaxID=189913 RepID=A0A5E4QMT8_9NEOP|nr:unnamed protein product [Leptidea sinapis]